MHIALSLSRFLRSLTTPSLRGAGLSNLSPHRQIAASATPSRNDGNGFTLIELSIVLVILGLIVGAIVGGKALIHQAELQQVIRQTDGYKTAINAFMLQYDALPGDFNDAYSYWGNTQCGDSVSIVNGAGDCNGNGNGLIESGPIPDDGIGYFQEPSMAWRHLFLAEITFEDTPRAGNNGVGYVQGPLDGSVIFIGEASSNDTYGRGGNALTMMQDVAGGWNDGSLTVKDAVAIDKKMDDGIAGGGNVRALTQEMGGFFLCANGSGEYNLDAEGTVCIPVFYLPY